MTQEEKPKEEKANPWVAIGILLIAVTAFISIYSNFSAKNYVYNNEVMGVRVYSMIPLTELQNYRNIALYNNSNRGAITCNFEIAAISTRDIAGYKVLIEEGEEGLFIEGDRAYIRGKTEDEILKACNVFACLIQGIECSPQIWGMREIIIREKKINVVVDSKLRGLALQGYGDVLGALGYIQAENAMFDLNGDGRISKEEIEENLIKIFPHIKEDNICRVQPITTQFQKLNATNETFRCDSLRPAIVLMKSDKNVIYAEGSRLIIAGDDERVGAGAIIVRDAISPEFIRSLYRIS